jgi:predicted amidohydrolase
VFSTGDLEPETVDFKGTRLGMMICFDWIYPEVARILALRGATILCHPSNLVLPHCPEAMITRCLENRVFAVTANRVGTEDWRGEPVRFTGMSQVVTPTGEVLGRAGDKEERVFVTEIETERAEDKVVQGNDIFSMRRPRLYRRMCR